MAAFDWLCENKYPKISNPIHPYDVRLPEGTDKEGEGERERERESKRLFLVEDPL